MNKEINMIKSNITDVQNKITEACRRKNRNISEVCLIAVSKTKPVSMIEECYESGIRDFG